MSYKGLKKLQVTKTCLKEYDEPKKRCAKFVETDPKKVIFTASTMTQHQNIDKTARFFCVMTQT